MTTPQIVCADPDADALDRTVARLRDEFPDCRVDGVTGLGDAPAVLEPDRALGVVAEYEFPDGDRTGLELLAEVRGRAPEAACVLYTDTPLAAISTERARSVVADFVSKGQADAEEMLRQVLQGAFLRREHEVFPVPGSEDDRLDALDQYPLSDPSLLEALDRLTAMAAARFDVAFSNVHVLSRSEQQSLACRGPTPLSAAREDSVCTYTVLTDGITEVTDLGDDPRFADKDYVREYDLDWYLGAPISTPAGANVGTFCLLGRGAHGFDEDDRADLRRFADEAADQFEFSRLRRANQRTAGDLRE